MYFIIPGGYCDPYILTNNLYPNLNYNIYRNRYLILLEALSEIVRVAGIGFTLSQTHYDLLNNVHSNVHCMLYSVPYALYTIL